jgi:hypothetical protein
LGGGGEEACTSILDLEFECILFTIPNAN